MKGVSALFGWHWAARKAEFTSPDNALRAGRKRLLPFSHASSNFGYPAFLEVSK
jgi:hypothetical protein